VINFRNLILINSEKLREQKRFGPYDTMDRLTRGGTNSTHRKRFRDFLGITIVAFCFSLRLSAHSWSGDTLMIGWTCPWKPVVPDSMRGTSAARHIRFTWRRASKSTSSQTGIPRLSNALKTISKLLKNPILKSGSLMFACRASSLTRGLNF
jgi:hypothetical protein